MAFFTFVLDYAGGTYVSQCHGDNEGAAYKIWLDRLVTHELAGGASFDVAHALQSANDPTLTPLVGLARVWCVTETASEGLVLLNLIETAE